MAYSTWFEGAPAFSQALGAGDAFGAERPDVRQCFVEAGN
jgi:hypothetical protein